MQICLLTPPNTPTVRNVFIWGPAIYLPKDGDKFKKVADLWGAFDGPYVPSKEVKRLEAESGCAAYRMIRQAGGSTTSSNLAVSIWIAHYKHDDIEKSN